jgi:hypothetical protein
VDGRAVAADACGEGAEGATRYRVALDGPVADPATVALRVRQQDGRYGGAALPEPVRFDCGRGRLSAGDWSAVDGLATYSGAVRYERPVTVDAETLRGAGRVTLDLGDVVASATVEVNGERVGSAASPPWTVDVTDRVEPGENRLAVTAYSTLANHYDTVPTRYGGDTTAGLLGPVELRVEYPVELDDDGTDRT